MFGSVDSVYLAHSVDRNIRFSASSGGFIKSFLCYLLDSKTVDYAIITRTGGVENPLQPETIITNSQDDILSTRTNSVYCVNNPFAAFTGIQDKEYVFVGLPCQIARARGLKVVIGLICSHAPTLGFTKEILGKLHIEESNIRQIEYRGHGWPGYFTAYLKDGNVSRIPSREVWNTRYMPGKCKRCSAIGERADIVVGDPWHLGLDETLGLSLVVCRNSYGSGLVRRAHKYIHAEPISYKRLHQSQIKHFRRKGERKRS